MVPAVIFMPQNQKISRTFITYLGAKAWNSVPPELRSVSDPAKLLTQNTKLVSLTKSQVIQAML